jgi:hypothetical protein
MTTLELGSKPNRSLTVNLKQTSDFVTGFVRTVDGVDEDFTIDETVTLIFGSDPDAPLASWPADLTDNVASWNKDKAVVAALIELMGSDRAFRVHYTNAAFDDDWYEGLVAIR